LTTVASLTIPLTVKPTDTSLLNLIYLS